MGCSASSDEWCKRSDAALAGIDGALSTFQKEHMIPVCRYILFNNSRTIGHRKLKFRIYEALKILLLIMQPRWAWHNLKVLTCPFSVTPQPLVLGCWNSGFWELERKLKWHENDRNLNDSDDFRSENSVVIQKLMVLNFN